ncbi:uncharacterized protein VTP21DRAFT_1030 [Calcarisporiella thermophila]|uniref:uncharacterized protein n=1 Tax=Calcarisporiella thermophila TaxID=911321 RepID=UPI0037427E33
MRVIDRIKAYRPWYSPRDGLHALFPGLVYFLICLYVACLANAYMDRKNGSNYLPASQRYRLPDPLMDSTYSGFQKSGLPTNLADTLVTVCAGLILLRILLGGRRTCIIARRAFFVVGSMYLFRAPFIVMTVLPNPLFSCQPSPRDSVWYDALVLLSQSRVSCGDVFYSGHTILFMVSALVWVEYPLGLHRLLHYLLCILIVLLSIFGAISLVISAYHYTMDVSVAVVFVFVTWKFYHLVVKTIYFDNTWYGKFLLWFDGERRFASRSPTRLPEMRMTTAESLA